MWSFLVENILIDVGLWDLVNGDEPCSTGPTQTSTSICFSRSLVGVGRHKSLRTKKSQIDEMDRLA